MRNLQGTKTEANLAAAFAGESQARNRYLFYSEKAHEEKYYGLERLFLETAENERGHAEMFFTYLTENGLKKELTVDAAYPFSMGNTFNNLIAAADGERNEWTNLYPSFGKTAEEEGFRIIAESFYQIASVEKWHDLRYRRLADRMSQGQLYDLPEPTAWVCQNCGLHITSSAAPEICPACHHPYSWFLTYYDMVWPVEY